jgi:predicted site-specific integrase-resolvase
MTEVLTTRAVAERFKVTPSAVSRWVHAGHLEPMAKIPGKRGAYLFTADEVDRFAREREAA